jgi:hypothetical protein
MDPFSHSIYMFHHAGRIREYGSSCKGPSGVGVELVAAEGRAASILTQRNLDRPSVYQPLVRRTLLIVSAKVSTYQAMTFPGFFGQASLARPTYVQAQVSRNGGHRIHSGHNKGCPNVSLSRLTIVPWVTGVRCPVTVGTFAPLAPSQPARYEIRRPSKPMPVSHLFSQLSLHSSIYSPRPSVKQLGLGTIPVEESGRRRYKSGLLAASFSATLSPICRCCSFALGAGLCKLPALLVSLPKASPLDCPPLRPSPDKPL